MPIETVRNDIPGMYVERSVKAVQVAVGETVRVFWATGSSIEAEFTATTDSESDFIDGLSDAIDAAKIAAGFDDMWSTVTVFLASSTEIVIEWEELAGEILAESDSSYPFTSDDLTDDQETAILLQLPEIPSLWESRNSLISGMLPPERIAPADFHQVIVTDTSCQGYPVVWVLLAERTGSANPTGHSAQEFYLELVQEGDAGNSYEFIWESPTRAWVDAPGDDWDLGEGPLWRLVKTPTTTELTCWIEDGVTPADDLTWTDNGEWDCFGSNAMVNVDASTDLSVALTPYIAPDDERIRQLFGRDADVNRLIGIDPDNTQISEGSLTGIVV